MWKYLEDKLGKVSAYYEMLMRSRDKNVVISNDLIDQVTELIKPLLLTAYEFSINGHINCSDISAVNNQSGKLPYLATLHHPKYDLHIYINQKRALSKDKNFMEVVASRKTNTMNESHRIESLPMWEQIIHMDVKLHKKIVELAPAHPWTLYRKTKSNLVNKSIENQLGGYPQWLINDVDYRIIKPLQFLFQYKLPDSEIVIYCFINPKSLETICLKQSL